MLLREKNGVDNMNDAVGLVDVGDSDFGHAALFVGQDDRLAHSRGFERAAAHGLQRRRAVAPLDGFSEVLA